jgi:hypothetical protein
LLAGSAQAPLLEPIAVAISDFDFELATQQVETLAQALADQA